MPWTGMACFVASGRAEMFTTWPNCRPRQVVRGEEEFGGGRLSSLGLGRHFSQRRRRGIFVRSAPPQIAKPRGGNGA